MNIFELTRALVDIESVTNNEEAVGSFLLGLLSDLTARTGGSVERCPVEANRFNVFAHWGVPLVTLSTHMYTVPPFFASSHQSRTHRQQTRTSRERNPALRDRSHRPPGSLRISRTWRIRDRQASRRAARNSQNPPARRTANE